MMVEVLVAASIIAVAVFSAMVVAEKSTYIARQSLHATQATFLLEEGTEAIRILRDNSWENISALTPSTTYYPVFTGGTWTLSTTPASIGIFTRTVFVENVERDASGNISDSGTDNPGTKLFTVTVSWQEGGTTVIKNLQFYLMDIFS